MDGMWRLASSLDDKSVGNCGRSSANRAAANAHCPPKGNKEEALYLCFHTAGLEAQVHDIIYLVGLVVVVLFILSVLGLR